MNQFRVAILVPTRGRESILLDRHHVITVYCFALDERDARHVAMRGITNGEIIETEMMYATDTE